MINIYLMQKIHVLLFIILYHLNKIDKIIYNTAEYGLSYIYKADSYRGRQKKLSSNLRIRYIIYESNRG